MLIYSAVTTSSDISSAVIPSGSAENTYKKPSLCHSALCILPSSAIFSVTLTPPMSSVFTSGKDISEPEIYVSVRDFEIYGP